MKLRIAIAVLCIAAFVAGRLSVSYRIPALALGDLRVVCTTYREPREEDLSGIRGFLENATWTDGIAFWKWPTDFVLKDGRKLRIDELTGLFVIDGASGYYKVRPADEAAFRNAIMKRAAKK